jgi:hypothetical protein
MSHESQKIHPSSTSLIFHFNKDFWSTSKDFHVVHDPRIITELCLVNKEHQVTKDETPENKEKIDVRLSATSGLQLC